jgi:hypothetical protein
MDFGRRRKNYQFFNFEVKIWCVTLGDSLHAPYFRSAPLRSWHGMRRVLE